MELKNTVEVIEFNVKTKKKKAVQFEEYYQAIGYIKSRRKLAERGILEKGLVYIITDLETLASFTVSQEVAGVPYRLTDTARLTQQL